jgi:hypothetical protein
MLRTTGGGDCGELIVASAYLPHDSDETPPSKEMRDIINYWYSKKKQLILGYDANAYHILLGSTDTNPRGEAIMEYLVSLNLDILHQGNEPTSVVTERMSLT